MLNDKQQAFVDEFIRSIVENDSFSSEYARAKAASLKAGYAESSNPMLIFKSQDVARAISEFSYGYLAMHGLKAANAILGVMDNPTTPQAKVKLDAAKEVLDRGGVGKRVLDSITEDQTRSIIIIPAKN